MIEFLAEWSVRSSILIACGAALLWALRVRDASIKLAAWTAMLCCSLAIPFLGAALPKLPLVMKHAPAARPGVASAPAFHPTPMKSRDREASDPHLAPASRYFDWAGAAAVLYALIAGALLLRVGVGLALSRRLLRATKPTEIAGIRESERASGDAGDRAAGGCAPGRLAGVGSGKTRRGAGARTLAHRTLGPGGAVAFGDSSLGAVDQPAELAPGPLHCARGGRSQRRRGHRSNSRSRFVCRGAAGVRSARSDTARNWNGSVRTAG